MAKILQQLLFVLIFGGAAFIAFKQFKRIYRNIMLGRKQTINDRPEERFKNTFLIAFGQKKMFKNVLPAVLHLFIYVAFLFTQIELIEIVLDGILGEHRLLYKAFTGTFMQSVYVGTISFIEILSLLALVATIAFIARRNILKVERFQKPEMKGWPTTDANIILGLEILLIFGIFTMNIADQAHHEGSYGFVISGMLWPIMQGWSESTLIALERFGWWLHLFGVLGFLVYLPYSKHLHIFLAFPNTYFARLEPKGYINNMPEITKEIKLMMNPDTAYAAPADGESAEPVKFGAKDVMDLSWKNLMDAYSCTECGRCTAACPANQTGKLLSPRKVMMDTRDRLEEVAKVIDSNGGQWVDDGKSLIEHNYITIEELRACTTCNACVEECPVMINPLDIIVQLRRNLIMEESNAPTEWTGMFANLENNGAPWQFSQQDRLNWVKE